MRRQLGVVLITFVCSGHALAETPGFFIGFGIGKSHIVEDETISVFLVPGQNLDERVDFQSAYGGYQFTHGFALEVGYTNLESGHKVYERRTDIIPPFPALRIEDLELEQISFGASVTSPHWRDFAALGIIGYSLTKVHRVYSAPGRFDQVQKSTEDAIYFGVGLAYRINEKLKARIQWTTSDAADFRIKTSRLSLEYWF